MFGSSKKEQSGPLKKTKNWYADRYQSAIIQRNFLLLVTLASLLGALIANWAVKSQVNSKTFEPYVIEVEEKTGIVTLVTESSLMQYAGNEAVKRYFVMQYINAREGYDPANYQYNYGRVVRLFSARSVYDEFRAYVSKSNPQSPVNLPSGMTRHVTLKSLTFLDDKKSVAQVRVVIEIRRAGELVEEQHRIATLNFLFAPVELDYQERLINPLGFQVTSYRIDEDVR